jgi:hypothetical protein
MLPSSLKIFANFLEKVEYEMRGESIAGRKEKNLIKSERKHSIQ